MARYVPACGGEQPVSPLAILLHARRLRRVRRAFATLNRRLTAFEAAYGTGAIRLTDTPPWANLYCTRY